MLNCLYYRWCWFSDIETLERINRIDYNTFSIFIFKSGVWRISALFHLRTITFFVYYWSTFLSNRFERINDHSIEEFEKYIQPKLDENETKWNKFRSSIVLNWEYKTLNLLEKFLVASIVVRIAPFNLRRALNFFKQSTVSCLWRVDATRSRWHIQGCFKASVAVIRLAGFTVNIELIKFLASGVTVSHSGDGYYNGKKSIKSMLEQRI